MSRASKPEPPPVPQDGQPSAHDLVVHDLLTRAVGHSLEIVSAVVADMRERKEMGLRKYNTILQPHNGRDSVVDAYQESLDLMAYLRNELEKRSSEPSLSLTRAYQYAINVALLLRREIEGCGTSA